MIFAFIEYILIYKLLLNNYIFLIKLIILIFLTNKIWGLGIGEWAQSPNPHLNIKIFYKFKLIKKGKIK